MFLGLYKTAVQRIYVVDFRLLLVHVNGMNNLSGAGIKKRREVISPFFVADPLVAGYLRNTDAFIGKPLLM